jgi:hypothetical protein
VNAPRDIEPGEHRCLTCKRNTRWVQMRSGQECEECRTRFPCRGDSCMHSDCDAARQEGIR